MNPKKPKRTGEDLKMSEIGLNPNINKKKDSYQDAREQYVDIQHQIIKLIDYRRGLKSEDHQELCNSAIVKLNRKQYGLKHALYGEVIDEHSNI